MSTKTQRQKAKKKFWRRNDRNEYRCPDCGRRQEETSSPFEVHHKDGDTSNNSLNNLVGLCRFCHQLREGNKPGFGTIRSFRDRMANKADRSLNPVVGDLDHQVNDYADLDLNQFTNTEADVYENKEAFLAACLRARALGAVDESSNPPEMALEGVLSTFGLFEDHAKQVRYLRRELLHFYHFKLSAVKVNEDDTVDCDGF